MTNNTTDESLFLQNLIDHLPKAMVYLIRGKISLNLKAEILTGYQSHDFRDVDDWFKLIYKEQALEVKKIYLNDKKNGFNAPARVPIIKKNGEVRTVEFHASIFGEIEVWILDDVTDKLIAEERFTSLFNFSSNAHLLFDEDDGIIDCNFAAVTLLKAQSKEELLKSHPAMFSPEYQPCGTRSSEKKLVMDSLARKNGSHRFEWIHKKMNGEDFPVEVTLTPIVSSNKKIHLVVWHDLTEYKNSQKLLEDERVKLFNSTKMASLGEMASGMAHEINNPLTVIFNKAKQINVHMTKLKSNAEIDPELIKSASLKIILTVERISKIIKGLTQFARDADLDDKVNVPIESIVNDVLDLCRARFASYGIEFKVNTQNFPEYNSINVFVNSIQIQQVLINLLNNAFDAIYLSENSWVEVGIDQTIKNKIDIYVKDSGKPIPEGIKEKIMNPFFTTKEVGKGTGLGLSISQGIMKSHDGELFICPNSLQTKFVMRLPIILM